MKNGTTRIATLPGDGIGPEVVGEACRVVRAIVELESELSIEFDEFPWGSEYYLEHGVMMPEDALERLANFDAILLGAVGDPRVPDDVTLWGMLLPIRQGFHQYINLRPIKQIKSALSPLADVRAGVATIDMMIVRENSEGEYAGKGFFLGEDTPHDSAIQVSVFSRQGVERVIRYALDLAQRTDRGVTSVSKANALNYSGVFWDKVFAEVAREYPEVPTRSQLVDAAALHMVLNPGSYEVVVGSNLFGDILSDLGAGLVGGLGLAPSANLNPEREFPSMFEPVHGSAPDIVGQDRANPVATIWAAAMMLGHLGFPTWERRVVESIEIVLQEGAVRTPDLGGSSTTREMTTAIIDVLNTQTQP